MPTAAALIGYQMNAAKFPAHRDMAGLRVRGFVGGSPPDPDGYWIEIVQPDLLARLGT